MPDHPSSAPAAVRAHPLLQGLSPLPHLGLIRLEGEDAAKFIHGQLTQDFVLLGSGEARLAAFCSAKGRMLASFVGFRIGAHDIVLVCSRDLLASTLKRLSMFVLRAKVRLSDASADYALFGLAGTACPEALEERPWALWREGDHLAVRLYPADGIPRALWLQPANAPAPAGEALAPELWQWSEVRSGVATLSQPLAEAFVPQMLNYESVGGVSFKKGCYPGQEVVARSQFRGTLKRRTTLAHCPVPLVPGQEIFQPSDASQPVGLVVQAAPAPEGGWDALVCLQTTAIADGQVLQTATADVLALHPLPYALLEDI